MVPRIEDYREVVGDEVINRLREKAEPLQGKYITNINAVSSGGGVAEILNTLVLLMNDLGIKVGWRILKGNQSFFDITKTFHNSLQGEKVELTDRMKKTYEDESLRNATMTHFMHHDLVVVHDPQPLAMIDQVQKKQPWVWRCHIDLTKPYEDTWNYLSPYIDMYDGYIVSMNNYLKEDIEIPHHIIYPSIDPLSDKNKELSSQEAENLLRENSIHLDKPIITQISRFDKWKDPLGVMRMYQRVKEVEDCQLVLMGDMPADDPEGQEVFLKVKQKAEELNDVTTITKRDDLLVNALQKMSHVVLQNSRREGFGLTVSEALWKKTPVVARDTGGITLQVKDGETGYLIENEDEGVDRLLELLRDKNLRRRLGDNGHQHVKKNFLITRQVEDYLDLYNNYID